MRPSSTCTRSITAVRGTRTTTSARNAGSVAPSVCSARTLTRAGVSSIATGRRANAPATARGARPRSRRRPDPILRCARVPIVTSIDRVCAGRQRTPCGLAVGDIGRRRYAARRTSRSARSGRRARTIQRTARIILSEVLRCSGAAVLVVRSAGAGRRARARAPRRCLPERADLAGRRPRRVRRRSHRRRSRRKIRASSTTPSYEFSALRNFRIGVSAEIRANDHVQVLGEVRLDQGRVFEAVRAVRAGAAVAGAPLRHPGRAAFRRPSAPCRGRAYGSSNIADRPAARLSIPDVDPARRAAGQRRRSAAHARPRLAVELPGRQHRRGPGLPLVNTSRWDTGVQAHGVIGMVEWTGSVTAGSLSDPRLRDNNAAARSRAASSCGRSAHGRSVCRRRAARGSNETLEDERRRRRRSRGRGRRRSAATRSISRGPFLVRGEVIRSSWHMPAFGDAAARRDRWSRSRCSSKAATRSAPGLYVAAARRAPRLQHGARRSADSPTWEAQTWRFEAGVGYSLTRNIIVKGAWQRNRRDGGRVRRDTLFAAQVLYWF